MLTEKELNRYRRNIMLPGFGTEGQEKLKKAKVLVVGAGGLGSPVLLYLTAAGIGTIGIVEFDKVDESNLQRQILYTSEETGESKIISAERKLSALNPNTKFILHEARLEPQNAENIIKGYDIVVDCPDNFITRYVVSEYCSKLGKPHVFGAIKEYDGQVSVFNYMGGPSYSDLFPGEMLKADLPPASQFGVLGVLPGIVGCIQVNEAIKIIVGVGEVLSKKLLMIDTLNNRFEIISI